MKLFLISIFLFLSSIVSAQCLKADLILMLDWSGNEDSNRVFATFQRTHPQIYRFLPIHRRQQIYFLLQPQKQPLPLPVRAHSTGWNMSSTGMNLTFATRTCSRACSMLTHSPAHRRTQMRQPSPARYDISGKNSERPSLMICWCTLKERSFMSMGMGSVT